MPQHKSAKKRVRQNNRKKIINKSILNKYRSSIVEFNKSVKQGDKKKSEILFKKANSAAFKAVSRGIVKSRAAARKISSLSKLLK